eukprot:m.267221 g.267221  ORF g.267221 m.267221 type:complete len:392 (+) comp19727_c0_seq4:72-1247(+)
MFAIAHRLAWQNSATVLLLVLNTVTALTNEASLSFLEKIDGSGDYKITDSGLRYRIIEAGSADGLSPQIENPCAVEYSGRLIDGTVFDQSRNTKTVNLNNILPGFREGIMMMKPGDEFELVLPPTLAFGDKSRGKIEAGSVIIFTVSLKEVYPEPTMVIQVWETIANNPLTTILIVMVLKFLFERAIGYKNIGREITLKSLAGRKHPRVFFDITIGDEDAGRIEFELFEREVPKTVQNFRTLCQRKKGEGYKGSTFHRIIPGFMCQGGDFTSGDGTGGHSIYGPKFDDEFDQGYISHSEPFLLSMANAGPNTNGSQFFVTTSTPLHLDGKHCVFGRVVSGQEIVSRIEACGTSSGKPSKAVIIRSCGEIAPSTKNKGADKSTPKTGSKKKN